MKTILVIEDETAVRENIIELLETEDFKVHGAENGEIGIKSAYEIVPDLIICDIMMPKVDGFGVLQALQSDDTTREIPFIFLTARAEKVDLREGMTRGADDYLTKPFTPLELFGSVQTRLEKSENASKKSKEKIDQSKNEMAAALPHELRTPLNGIIATTDFLIKYSDTLSSDEIHQMHYDILKSGQRLNRLISNYLFYVELEINLSEHDSMDKYKTMHTENCSAMIDEVLNETSNRFANLNQIDSDLVDANLVISKYHFLKIIEELVDNAFKFAGSETVVKIRSEVINNQYKISLTNYGRGISKQEIQSIGAFVQFNRKFYEQQGSGLGLTIVKRLMKLYDYNFEINSIVEEFTEVVITIPLAKDEEIEDYSF